MDFKGIDFIIAMNSKYIQRDVFLYLNEKQKLYMIIYNKKLQKICNVDIEDYKRVSGKYKIGEKNGIGKIYNLKTNELIFEGEFLNGKKKGKGKEYYDGELIFEGEFLNGKRDGKGKEYYDGELIFEGEYLNGKRNGKGKEYYNNNELKFEGQYLDGKIWNGKGYIIKGKRRKRFY